MTKTDYDNYLQASIVDTPEEEAAADASNS